MSENQSYLVSIFGEAFRQLDRKHPIPSIDARFYPYAGLHHTIRVRAGRVYVRLSDIFKDAPVEAQRALAFILVARVLRRPAPKAYENAYRAYSCAPEVMRASEIARRQRGRKMLTSPRGNHYDLDRLFARLNRRHFDNSLAKPTLSWSQRRTRNILGHHDSTHDAIVISKTLDAPDVPEWFVEFILYHEMLHIKHTARVINGRRYHHTKAFRAEEQRFPYYTEAQKWLDHIARQRRTQRLRAA